MYLGYLILIRYKYLCSIYDINQCVPQAVAYTEKYRTYLYNTYDREDLNNLNNII